MKLTTTRARKIYKNQKEKEKKKKKTRILNKARVTKRIHL